ncbi:MAG: MBL fold metallo-hydrolase [Lactobacillales bacterium]|jgi:glyoxylase-like metal-dependent hydrolase (beta-lactamase superfamily II)|nr:MBL fold metallo-hydrolase [Lactobacillales bacterium]
MRITSHGNIHQITFLPYIFPVNSYIYEEETTLTLIDIGTSSLCKPIVQLSRELKKPVTTILFTHPHSDHIAGLDKIMDSFPDAKVYVSERDAPLLEGDFSLKTTEEQTKIKGGFTEVKTTPDFLMKENDTIGSLTVLAAPGHTPGSLAFYDKKSGILIVGDALQVKGGVAVAGDTRLFFPFPAFATWSKNEAVKSAKKLSNLKIRLLATGHGDMLEDPKELILNAIARAEANL